MFISSLYFVMYFLSQQVINLLCLQLWVIFYLTAPRIPPGLARGK